MGNFRHTGPVSDATPAARVTYREVLAVREFRAILISQGLSIIGDQVARIAVALLVYDKTGSAFAASGTYAIGYLTWLCGGPVLSALADRYTRLTVMVTCDLARAALVAVLIIPDLALWSIFGLLMLVGLLSPPFDSARSATLPDVLHGDQYVVGNGLINVVVQTGQVAGFLAGGALVATVGVQRALLFDVATFLVSAGALLFAVHQRPTLRRVDSTTTLLQETREGFGIVRRSRELRSLLAFALLGMATVIAPEGLAVSLSDELGGGAAAAGALTASIPLGFVLGSVAVLRVPSHRRAGLLTPLCVLSAVPLLATPITDDIRIVFALWTVAGVGSAMQLITNAAYLQAAPAEARGRVFGVAAASLMGIQGVTLLASGGLAEVVSPSLSVAAAAAAALIALPLVRRTSPSRQCAAQGIAADARGSQE